MALSNYLQNCNAFLLVSGLLVFVFVYLGIRIYEELSFVYYHATFIEIGYDQDGHTKVFNEIGKGFIIRRNKKGDEWEMSDPNGVWTELPPNKVLEVKDKISNKQPVYLYFR